ncbi:Cell growth-regulating nucleolar protein [Symbiodinium microadriaticum]|uniref:Cell growth-regulating nucleolar protein n=1 Tax=Symbiodinium microadriaticum TaxID=2951 RepID=A0A1Q9C8K5_SYMMI|nr:Cell growth-regulating nucleolar protein [Symbiodinium microadriaticum]
MVYFECGLCNETVKKPKLAQHLQRCGSWTVSCIDCSKVFAWDEWQSHTSCVSEAQKYQGNLFQAKESSNKGQLKQDSWVDGVRRAIEDPQTDVAPQIRSLVQKLLGFDNIPRKQKAFGNFVKNSLKVWDEAKIDAMWNVIASANSKPVDGKPSGQAATEPAKMPKAKAWPGWKRAIDEELTSGAMPWKRLCARVVERYRESGHAGDNDELELQALSSIPEDYCSSKTPDVMLCTSCTLSHKLGYEDVEPTLRRLMRPSLKAVRLSTLLRGFGLCPVEISKQESKSAISFLKAAYRDKAKEQHPDLAPRDEQAEAEKKFVKLSTEFNEAVKLLEAGVQPVERARVVDLNPGAQAGAAHAAWHPHFQSADWRTVNRQFVHSEQPKFDTYTRVKGHLIVWSSAFIFFSLLREFLVGTAGGMWAWYPPQDLNPFWVRRYHGAWSDKDKPEKREQQQPSGPPQVKREKDRPVSEFYAKRHVSKVRKKYSPRGHGPSL